MFFRRSWPATHRAEGRIDRMEVAFHKRRIRFRLSRSNIKVFAARSMNRILVLNGLSGRAGKKRARIFEIILWGRLIGEIARERRGEFARNQPGSACATTSRDMVKIS